MSEIKSPYLSVPEYNESGYPVDFAKLQRQIRLRPMPRQRPVTRGGLLWGFAINCVLWAMIVGVGRWIYLLWRQ